MVPLWTVRGPPMCTRDFGRLLQTIEGPYILPMTAMVLSSDEEPSCRSSSFRPAFNEIQGYPNSTMCCKIHACRATKSQHHGHEPHAQTGHGPFCPVLLRPTRLPKRRPKTHQTNSHKHGQQILTTNRPHVLHNWTTTRQNNLS
jgi:hypothetical protein